VKPYGTVSPELYHGESHLSKNQNGDQQSLKGGKQDERQTI